MRLLRVVFAFILTLALFWGAPAFEQNGSESEFLEATAPGFLVDHIAISDFSGEGSPELSAHITTPADTQAFRLLLFCCRADTGDAVGKVMPRVAGTLDLHSFKLPPLQRGHAYRYHLELQDSNGSLLARLPEEPQQEITLTFHGELPLWLLTSYIGLLFLAAMFSFLSLIDSVWLRSDKIILTKASQKVAATAVFLLLGGVIAGAAVSLFRNGFLWAGWPIGRDLSQSFVSALLAYWILLTLVFRGAMFGFKPQKDLTSAGGAAVLTLLGVILLVITYLTVFNF